MFFVSHIGSQTSLQSWASSLSYDSQSEDPNEIKEFMKAFVEDIFKQSSNITVDKKAEFGKLAQVKYEKSFSIVNIMLYC